jgi:hypothetical protein
MPQHGAPGIITGSLNTILDFEIARNLSKAGQQAHVRALTRSLDTGQPETWQLGQESGTASPAGRRYTDAQGRPCQDQDEEVRIEGRTIRKRGTYCWDSEGNLTKVASHDPNLKQIAGAAVCFRGKARGAYSDHAPCTHNNGHSRSALT